VETGLQFVWALAGQDAELVEGPAAPSELSATLLGPRGCLQTGGTGEV
jgi:hypothetical protein